MAIEDIGLADPQALVIANAAKDAYDFLGSPEGELAIAQAVIYVATAPKSNAAYAAYGAAMRAAKEAGSLLPPKHILNAPTKLMQIGRLRPRLRLRPRRGRGVLRPELFPRALPRQQFYNPPERGFEREIRKRLDYWAKLRKERGGNESTSTPIAGESAMRGTRSRRSRRCGALHRLHPQAIAFENLDPLLSARCGLMLLRCRAETRARRARRLLLSSKPAVRARAAGVRFHVTDGRRACCGMCRCRGEDAARAHGCCWSMSTASVISPMSVSAAMC